MTEAASKPRGPVKAPAKRAPKPRPEPAVDRPVARISVDMPLAHLDRPFDYLVPAAHDAAAVPGARVRVRFAGQLVDGYLLERVDESAHGGRLAFLERVVSAEPVLHPEIVATGQGRCRPVRRGRSPTCSGWRCRPDTPAPSPRSGPPRPRRPGPRHPSPSGAATASERRVVRGGGVWGGASGVAIRAGGGVRAGNGVRVATSP